MKQFIFGCFAMIILSATAISATNKSNSIMINHSSVFDTTPHKMHKKMMKGDSMNKMRNMDSGMNESRDSM